MGTCCDIVIIEEEIIEVVEVGSQGVAGPPGTGGAAEVYIAGEVLSGHMAVVVNASGDVIKADKDTSTKVDVVGITTGAAAVGFPVTVQFSGTLINAGWSWTPNAEVYLGNAGALTQSLPASGFFVTVGIATDTDRILIDAEPPIQIA